MASRMEFPIAGLKVTSTWDGDLSHSPVQGIVSGRSFATSRLPRGAIITGAEYTHSTSGSPGSRVVNLRYNGAERIASNANILEILQGMGRVKSNIGMVFKYTMNAYSGAPLSRTITFFDILLVVTYENPLPNTHYGANGIWVPVTVHYGLANDEDEGG